jgi:hypothetical protein
MGSLRGLGWGAEEAGLLELELVELLLAVHLDDEGHHQDEEGGAGDPRRLAGALQELLRHERGVARRLPAPQHDGRPPQPRDHAAAGLTALRAPPLRQGHSASSGLGRHSEGNGG